jgi:Leucine-rich repeat (LRR) protein
MLDMHCRLEELHLINNELGSLPPELSLLSGTLRSLGVEGNPLRTIRRPIIEKGTAGILAYLKDRLPV